MAFLPQTHSTPRTPPLLPTTERFFAELDSHRISDGYGCTKLSRTLFMLCSFLWQTMKTVETIRNFEKMDTESAVHLAGFFLVK